jgi:hypothetical protein
VVKWWLLLRQHELVVAGPEQLLGVRTECISACAANGWLLPRCCWLHRQWRSSACAQHHKQNLPFDGCAWVGNISFTVFH